ncbi:MAG: transglutaminase-like domain-containing protein [Bacteriodetes bacterium]|nr:transglutaminase-like domain-containing protein [Bacteroidota bacterium]
MKNFFIAILLTSTSISLTFAKPSTTSSVATDNSAQLPLKKIIVVESNNVYTSGKYKKLGLPKSLFEPQLLQLKDFVSRRISFANAPETEFLYKMMEWVSMRWEHHGNIAPPAGYSTFQILQYAEKNKVQFRCQDYAQTLNDILLSYGFVSRVIGLQTSDVAYSTIGGGHVAVEVWSNTQSKWIYLDPQWAVYATLNTTPLNFAELAKLHQRDSLQYANFHVMPKVLQRSTQDSATYMKEYYSFVTNYFGSMQVAINRNGLPQTLTLQMENKQQYLTFQGLPANNVVFTSHHSDVYFDINRCTVLLSYMNNPAWNEVFDDVQTPDDYRKRLPKVAAKPEFAISCDNSMPWFSYYMVRLNNNAWVKLGDSSYTTCSLQAGINTIDAYCVNKANREGTHTIMRIFYGTDAEYQQFQTIGKLERRKENSSK